MKKAFLNIMKKLKNIIVIVVISIIFIGIFLFSSISDKQKIKLNRERSMSNSIALIEKVNLNDQYDVIKSIRDSIFLISWKKPNKGNLYFYDKQNKQVNKYFAVGKNVLIGDYYENLEEDFIILSKTEEELLKTNRNGKITETIDLKTSISRGILLKNNFYFVGYGDDVNMKFYKNDLESKNIIEIKNKIFSKNEKNTGIIYDGVLKHNNDQIILTPYAKNEVLLFDSDFKFKSKMNLINKDIEYKFTKMQNGDVLPDLNNIYPNIFSDVNNHKLYVLTNDFGLWDIKDNYYIDVYDTKSQKYIISYPINDKDIFPREILVLENIIYILGKDKLNIYEIK